MGWVRSIFDLLKDYLQGEKLRFPDIEFNAVCIVSGCTALYSTLYAVQAGPVPGCEVT